MNAIDFARCFRRQLELCKVKSGETIVMLTDPSSNRTVVENGLAAVAEFGAFAYEIRVQQGRVSGHVDANPFEIPGVMEALDKANVAVCLFSAFFSRWHKPFRARGGRILNVLDVPEQLVRLQSGEILKAAVLSTRDRLRTTKSVRVSSEAGTDLRYEIDHDAPLFTHYGFADEPGHMDHWGQGMIAMFPAEGSANGTVVIQPGDVWILPHARMVQSAITLDIQDGFVEHVEGGLDAGMFRTWLDSCKMSDNDKDPYAVSHLGWGLNPAARWEDILHYENQVSWLAASMRSFPGNFLFSTGPGHRRITRGHIDMPMRHCSIELDGEKVIDKGRIIAPEMIVDPKRCSH